MTNNDTVRSAIALLSGLMSKELLHLVSEVERTKSEHEQAHKNLEAYLAKHNPTDPPPSAPARVVPPPFVATMSPPPARASRAGELTEFWLGQLRRDALVLGQLWVGPRRQLELFPGGTPSHEKTRVMLALHDASVVYKDPHNHFGEYSLTADSRKWMAKFRLVALAVLKDSPKLTHEELEKACGINSENAQMLLGAIESLVSDGTVRKTPTKFSLKAGT